MEKLSFTDPVILKAFERMAVIHQPHARKGSGLPFSIHPINTFLILAENVGSSSRIDANTLAAAILHDVFKQVKGYGYKQLAAEFNREIASLVREVTEFTGRKGEEKTTWKERKYGSLEKFSQMSPRAQHIYVADKVDNIRQLVDDYKSYDIKIWERFNAPEEDIAKYYFDIFEALTAEFRSPLIAAYHKAYTEAVEMFGWKSRHEEWYPASSGV